MIRERDLEAYSEQANGYFLEISPEELIRNNPAAQIVNLETYASFERNFQPDMWQHPQAVRVQTYSAEHDANIKIFIRDGLTRTKYTHDHPEQLQKLPETKARNGKLVVQNVTSQLMQDRKIVPLEEKQDGQDSLTLMQYLRAVIDPTKEHIKIAPDRIAVYLINAWDNMVGGPDLARRFSALVALNFIADTSLATNALKATIERQEELIPEESMDDRVTLTNKLLEMAAIIRESALQPREVAKSAFMLVSSQSEAIGGEREARKQVYGLVDNSLFEQKLRTALGPNAQAAKSQLIERVAEALFNCLTRFASSDERTQEQVYKTLNQALNDKHLGFEHIIQVAGSSSPAEEIISIRQQVNRDRLEQQYMRYHKVDAISAVEYALITNLGGKPYLNEEDISKLIMLIKNTDLNIQKAERFLNNLAAHRDELIHQGVLPGLIDEVSKKIADLSSSMSQIDTPRAASLGIQGLTTTIIEVERQMGRQIARRKVDLAISQVYGDRLKSGFGPQIRGNIISYILREIDTTDEAAILNRLQELAKLDDDLQAKVIGGMRITNAIRLQKERNAEKTRPAVKQPPAIETPVVEVSTPIPSAIPSPVEQPLTIVEPETQQDTDRLVVEARRRKQNNDGLLHLNHPYLEAIKEIDLSPEELKPDVRLSVIQILRELGRICYGQPDINRIIENYQRELEARIATIEARVQDEQQGHFRPIQT